MIGSSLPALRAQSFGVAFGEQVVLADVSLTLPATGMTVLVGPAGSGKSTFLRCVAGLNDVHPAMSTWGQLEILGEAVTRDLSRRAQLRPGVGLVQQHARFYLDTVRENLVSALPNRSSLDSGAQTELIRALLDRCELRELTAQLNADVASLPRALQRRLAIARSLVADPGLLLADEPGDELALDEGVPVIRLLQREAERRAVIVVTHNQQLAKQGGGTTVLLAAGRVQERAPTSQFFSAPRSEAGQAFVRTGSCALPSPNAQPSDLADDVAPPPPLPAAAQSRSRHEGPRGFFWVWPGRLGGLPRPGIVASTEEDLAGLARLGVTVVVTLEETLTVPGEVLAAHGMDSIHFPIVDMSAPALASAERLCREIQERTERGACVAMHCRAGLGRTGTMLACQLIYAGESARAAIERVRALQPRCIQSDAQVEFLATFELHVSGRPLAKFPFPHHVHQGGK